MPKTPSQKKNSRRKRVSLGRQEESQATRRFVTFITHLLKATFSHLFPNLSNKINKCSFLSRFSKGKRSNLRGSSVKSLNFIAEEGTTPEASTSEADTTTQPKRTTRKNKQTKPEVAESVSQSPQRQTEEEEEEEKTDKSHDADVQPDSMCGTTQSPPKIPSPNIVVNISPADRLSAELAKKPESSPGRTAAKIAIADTTRSSRRSSVRCSLKLRHSLAGLRHSMTQESIRRSSRRSMLKRRESRMGNSTCSNNIDGERRAVICF